MATTARLFKNGRSQAVRLPREFRFAGDRVRVRRAGRGVLVEPIFTDVSAWFAELDRLATEPFMLKAANSRLRRGETCSMTTYLLDTNACIALINGNEANVRKRFQRAVGRESVILLSSIVQFELWYGVAKSQRKESNAVRLDAFCAGPLEWTLFDEEDARAAGTIRAELETIGKPMVPMTCCWPVRRGDIARRS